MPQYDELGAGLGNNPAPVSLGQNVNPATQVLDEPTVDENLIRKQLIERGDFARARGRSFSHMTPGEFEGAYKAVQAEAAKPRRSDGTVIEETNALGRGMSNAWNQAKFGVFEDPEALMQVNENQRSKPKELVDFEGKLKTEAEDIFTEEDTLNQFGEAVGLMASNPGHTLDMVVEQLPNAVPAIAGFAAGGFAGAKVGAAIGTIGGPAGTLIGGILGTLFGAAGAAIGSGLGSGASEYVAEKVQQVTERVGDPNDLKQVMAAINDPALMDDAERAAFLKATGVGLADAATAMLTFGISKVPGVGKAVKGSLGFGVESAGEVGGEYAGQALQVGEGYRDEIDYGDVGMEGLLGAGQSLGTTVVANATEFGIAKTPELKAAQEISVEQKMRELHEGTRVGKVDPANPFKNDYTNVKNPVGASREQEAQRGLPADQQREVGEVLFTDVGVAKSAHNMNKYADHFGMTEGLGNKLVEDNFRQLMDKYLFNDAADATARQEATDAIDGFLATIDPQHGADATGPRTWTAASLREEYESRLKDAEQKKNNAAKTKIEEAQRKLADNAKAKASGKPAEKKAETPAAPAEEVKTPQDIKKDLGEEVVTAAKKKAAAKAARKRETKPDDVVVDVPNIPEENVENEVVQQNDDFAPPMESEQGGVQEGVQTPEDVGGRSDAEASPVPTVAESAEDSATGPAVTPEAPIDVPPITLPEQVDATGVDQRDLAINDAEARLAQSNNRLADFKSREVQDISVKLAISRAENELAKASADLQAAKAMPVDTSLVDGFLDQAVAEEVVNDVQRSEADVGRYQENAQDAAPDVTQVQQAAQEAVGEPKPRFGKPRGGEGYADERGAKAGVARRYPGINMDEVTAVQDKKTGKWFLEVNPDYQMPAEKVTGKGKSKLIGGKKNVAFNVPFKVTDPKTGSEPSYTQGAGVTGPNGHTPTNNFMHTESGLQVQTSTGEWVPTSEVWVTDTGPRDMTREPGIIASAPAANEGQAGSTFTSDTQAQAAVKDADTEKKLAIERRNIDRKAAADEKAAQVAPRSVTKDVTDGNLAKFEKLHDKLSRAREGDDIQKAMAAFAKAKEHIKVWFPELNIQSLKDYNEFASAIQSEGVKQYDRPTETIKPEAVETEVAVDDSDIFESEVVYDAPAESGDVQKEVIKTTAESDASFIAQLDKSGTTRVDKYGTSVDKDDPEYHSNDTSTPLVIGEGAEAQVFWNGTYVPVNELELGAREQLLRDQTLFGDDFDVDAVNEDDYDVYDAKIPAWATKRPEMGEPDAAVVSAAEALAKKISKASGHKVVVVSSKEEFIANNPKVANKLLESHPTLGGYYDKVKDESVVWVWPGNTVEDITKVILHETVGHGGMENLFGNKWLNFTNKVIDTNMKALIDSFANTPSNYGHKAYNLTSSELVSYRKNKKALGYDWVVIGSEANGGILKKVTRKHAQMLIREHIARQAERFVTDPQLLDDLSPGAKHWFHRVMAYVRHLLRPYIKFKVSDADILSLLAESHDRTVEGKDRSAYMEEKLAEKSKDPGDLMAERHKYESDDIWKDRWEKDSKRQLRENDEWDGIYASDAPQSANANNAAKSGAASTKGHNAVDVSVVTDDMRAAESQVVWLDKARQGADRMLRSLRNAPYIGKLMHNKLMPGASKFEMLNRVHKGRVDANARRATQLHKMLAKLPADQLKKISDAWTGGEAFSALGLNPPQVALLTQGRKDLEEIQQMLNTMTYKGHKILTDDQLEETGGKFLHTEYMRYLAAYRGSGKTPSGFDWMKRRTATKATEAQLEKISNASYTIPSTLGLVGRDTHLLRFMEDVAENAKNVDGPAWVVDSRATFNVGLAGGEQNMTINQIRHEMDITAEALNQERMAHVGTDTEAKAILESNLEELNRVYSENEEARLDNVANAMYQSGGKYARVTPSGNVQEKLMQDIPREDKEAFLEENFVWVTKKDYPNLLPFHGKYVHKEIINEFTQMDNSFEAEGVQKNGFAKAVGDATASGGFLDSTTRAWKLSKTGLNIPAYYMRNLIGNMFLLDISTSTNAASLTIDVGKEALATIKGSGKKYGDHTLKEWADKFGLYSTTYGASELYFLADDFERQMKKDSAKKNNQFMKMAGYEVKDSMMWLAEKTADMHGLMEGIFKQVVMKDYIARWEKGEAGKRTPRKFNSLSATQQMGLMAAATEEAGNAIFDYDKVPNWARTLRRTPFGTPFMTFNYKMAGALPRAMLKHPWKMARYYAAPGMVSAALMATGIADFDDDEMEEISKKVPWYMRNRSGFLIMPLKDANGKVQYFDLTYIFPPTLFTDAYLKMMNQEPGDNVAGAFKDLAFGDLGLLGGPIPQALTAGLANKDPFTGRDIWVDGDLPVNNWERTATWVWNMAMPPVLTEGGALGRSFNQAGIDLPMISSGQEFTKYGTDKETGAQTFWRGMGLSGGGFSPQEATRSNEKRFKYKLNQIQKAMRKAAIDKNKNRMERTEAVRAYEAQIRELRRHRMRSLNG